MAPAARRRERRGMTLIEAIMALALAFFLMVGTAEMLVLALRVQSRARSVQDMTSLVSGRLETLRANTAASGARGALTTVADGSEEVVGRAGRRYTLSWTAASGTGSPLVVEVRIFPDGAPERTFALPLFISRELGF
jgi:hypothetical protein